MNAPDHRALWAACRNALRWDGALRDLYVRGADLQLWDLLLHHLARSASVTSVWDASVPTTAAEAFARSSEQSLLLVNRVGRLHIHCHFFTESEIEFDLDPRELESETDFCALLQFMSGVGDALGRDVDLTEENCPEATILRYVFVEREFRPALQPAAQSRGP